MRYLERFWHLQLGHKGLNKTHEFVTQISPNHCIYVFSHMSYGSFGKRLVKV